MENLKYVFSLCRDLCKKNSEVDSYCFLASFKCDRIASPDSPSFVSASLVNLSMSEYAVNDFPSSQKYRHDSSFFI